MPRKYVRKTDSLALSKGFRALPFWDRVSAQTVSNGGCEEFTGCKDESGYGRINRDGKLVRLHRAVWEREHGPIAQGMVVCHVCDNRACIKLAHLFLGTQKDNMRDCSEKGRNQRGSLKASAKLDEAKVSTIKRMLRDGASNAALSREYGVSTTVVSHIRHGQKWRHVS